MALSIITYLAELLGADWFLAVPTHAEYAITLIADPLQEETVQAIARAVSSVGVKWRVEGNVCEIGIGKGKNKERKARTILAAHCPPSVDYIFQPVMNRGKKLLIADMESTIITCECLDELAELVGIRDKIAAITARAMNGELNFEDALRERVALLKGLPESALQEVYDKKVRLMPGAEALVSAMKANGAYTMLVSGGFDFYTSRIAARLGFDEHRSNRLEIENGVLTGRVIEPILNKDAKLQALHETCKKLGIGPEDVLAVGDGANDLPMLLAAGLGVAYHAKPNVRAQAKTKIDHADLTALLFAQGL